MSCCSFEICAISMKESLCTASSCRWRFNDDLLISTVSGWCGNHSMVSELIISGWLLLIHRKVRNIGGHLIMRLDRCTSFLLNTDYVVLAAEPITSATQDPCPHFGHSLRETFNVRNLSTGNFMFILSSPRRRGILWFSNNDIMWVYLLEYFLEPLRGHCLIKFGNHSNNGRSIFCSKRPSMQFLASPLHALTLRWLILAFNGWHFLFNLSLLLHFLPDCLLLHLRRLLLDILVH